MVGTTACLLFGAAAHYGGQQQILAILTSINFGYVAAIASTYLWSPLITTHHPLPWLHTAV